MSAEGRLSWSAIEQYAADFPDDTPRAIAAALVGGLTEEEIRAYAVQHVVTVIEAFRRAQARLAEMRAEEAAAAEVARAAAMERAAAEDARRAEWQAHEAEERARTAEMRRTYPARKAAKLAAAAEAEALLVAAFADLRDDADTDTLIVLNDAERARFRDWMGDAYSAWYDARTRLTPYGRAASRPLFEPFVEDAYGDNHLGYFTLRMSVALWDMQVEAAKEARLQLTAELLGTRFALGDGTRTTWGDATREQHQQRAVFLTKQAAGTVETAVRHQVAIRMLDESGAISLREIVTLAGAA